MSRQTVSKPKDIRETLKNFLGQPNATHADMPYMDRHPKETSASESRTESGYVSPTDQFRKPRIRCSVKGQYKSDTPAERDKNAPELGARDNSDTIKGDTSLESKRIGRGHAEGLKDWQDRDTHGQSLKAPAPDDGKVNKFRRYKVQNSNARFMNRNSECLLSKSPAAVPLICGKDAKVSKMDDIYFLLNDNRWEVTESAACKPVCGNSCYNTLNAQQHKKDNDIPVCSAVNVQGNDWQAVGQAVAQSLRITLQPENILETSEAEVLVQLTSSPNTTSILNQSQNDTFRIPSNGTEILPIPAIVGDMSQGCQDEFFRVNRDLSPKYKHTLNVPKKEIDDIAADDGADNLTQIRKSESEQPLPDVKQFWHESNDRQTIDETTADQCKNNAPVEESCITEQNQNDGVMLPEIQSHEERKWQLSHSKDKQERPDSKEKDQLSDKLPDLSLVPEETLHNDDSITLSSKVDDMEAADKLKNLINGPGDQTKQTCNCEHSLINCKLDKKKNESSPVTFPENEKLVNAKLEKQDTETAEISTGKEYCKSPRTEPCLQPSTETKSVENIEYQNSQETRRDAHLQKGKYFNEHDMEYIDSKSRHLMCQLETVKMYKRKADALPQQFHSIVNEVELPVEQVKQDAQCKALSHTPLHRAKNKQHSWAKATRTSPSRPPRRNNTKNSTGWDNKHPSNQDESNKMSQQLEAKTTSFEYVDHVDEDHLKLSVNDSDYQLKRTFEGKEDNARIQIPVTIDSAPNKSATRLNERTKLNFAVKCDRENTKFHESAVNNTQPPKPRQPPRSWYKGETKHRGGFQTQTKTPGVYFNSIDKEQCCHRGTPDRAHFSNKHEHMEHIQQPISACWGAVPPTEHGEYTSNTSESLDSVCVYSDGSPAKNQTVKSSCNNEEFHNSLTRGGHQSSTRSGNGSSNPVGYPLKNELKTKYANNFEIRQSKIRQSMLTDSLKAAVNSANESISAATKVAEALCLVALASSFSCTSVISEQTDTMVMENKRYHGRSAGLKDNAYLAEVQSRAFSESPQRCSRAQLVEQVMFTHNIQRNIAKLPQRANRKKRYRKQQSKQHENKSSLPDNNKIDIHSRYPGKSNTDQNQIGIVSGGTSVQQTASGNLLLTEHSPQTWNDTTNVTKCCPGDKVKGRSCPHTHMGSLAPYVVTRSPKITVHITFTKSPDIPHKPKVNSHTQRSASHKEKPANDSCFRTGHGSVHNQSPSAFEYELSSDGTPSQEECTLSHSYCGANRITDACFHEVSPCMNQIQDYAMPTNQAYLQPMLRASTPNTACSECTQINAHITRSQAGKHQ